MSEAVKTGKLESCPRCLYSLRGLPVEHRCPECGLTVDLRWRVFGGRMMSAASVRPMRLMLMIPVAALTLAFAASLILLFLRSFSIWMLLQATTLGGVWLFLGWTLFAKPKKFVAVGPEGMFVHWRPTRFEHYPWGRIGRARYNLFRKSVDIELNDRLMRLSAFTFFRGNVFEAEDCVRSINALARHDPK